MISKWSLNIESVNKKTNMNLEQKVGAFIKHKREKLGYTQEHLGILVYGDEVKHVRQRVYKVESGTSGLTLTTIQRFLKVLNADLELVEL